MVQRQRCGDDVKRAVGKRQSFALATDERQPVVVPGASLGNFDHLRAVVETGHADVDVAPAAVAHERARDVAATASDVEDRARAGTAHLAADRCDPAEPAVRELDVGQVAFKFVDCLDRPVHDLELSGSTFHGTSRTPIAAEDLRERRTIEKMLIVLKYGGNAMTAGADDPVLDEIAALARAGTSVVVVHGGGPQIDAALKLQNIPEERIEGLRVTSARVRDVVEAVLCGTVNKDLVRGLLARGARAFGFAGEDAGILTARRMTVPGGDLGYVGEPAGVDAALLHGILGLGVLPVIAPLGLDPVANVALNLNADTAAGAIAAALGADAYVVLTNVAGVRRDRRDPASVIPRLTIAEAEGFLADGTFADGMRPKMRAAIEAVAGGARRAVIAEAVHDGIGRALAGAGTELLRS